MSIETDEREGGLTEAQVAQLRSEGKSNDVPARASRSVKDIVRGNVFTRINAILGVLLLIVLSTGSIVDGMFGLLIIANSGIGIIQEIRAKKTLDELAIVGQNKPVVRRDGVAREVAPDEVVLGDVIELGPGDQIVVDGEIIETASLEVDESLLTGEADAVHKTDGAQVLSGSFVVSGSGAYRATKVGRDAYAARLAEEASKFTLVHSELRSGIDRILKFITYLMIPAGALIIYNQLFSSGQSLGPALNGMVAALVPMVPEGLVLMTSIAFAVGVVRLGQRKCLVQELPAIEGLARVDVVCADKTGTLTENGMRLSELRVVEDGDGGLLTQVLAALAHDDPRPNASVLAIAEAFPDDPNWTETAVAPFSSAKKWSGLSYGDHGNWLLGAPDVLLDADTVIARQAEDAGSSGLRVLLLASSDLPVDDAHAPGVVTPRALVILEQKVRSDARETLDYFASQSVSVKVISGDNAVSVGAVAGSLGLEGSPVDARTLPENDDELADTVESGITFGRVRPDQKRQMVGALQSRGHTVAMTGDGVNDVLALKDADIGVAMGSGSAATRAVAQIVLLDNKFATLPYVVGEGRRVIGNIERVSNLFLTKTVYSVLLAFLIGTSGVLSQIFHFEPLPYPFLPRHVTIAAWFTIGIPAFILSLAPNNERARTGFVGRVMRLAVPSGLIVGVATFVSYLLAYQGPEASETQVTQASTTALITLIMIAVWVLAVVARPYVWWKILLLAGSVVGYLLLFTIPFCRTFFKLDPSNIALTTTALVIGAIGIVAVEAAWWISAALHGERRRLFAGAPA
ncbi:HAD-IC family P-type ATPase [Rhodococcus sp. BP-252]|uniref:HAD-IC family P-type ATPase n=1 Tax=unclassified Rhodococcus (in: high G+C Gram-positive bacteria) TaxID=192944 RepID=UPI001C9BB042|nr:MULTISPECIES: HAD-IC family P-type ATPase [unclassified Rhodococcus (in: high G+C Gram-positive bacteria)]MBY6413101.1 HAD-IC family P-type ATPase [Rhodococcus sp. BP-320]MBY6417736.1 HAD-IC family P-type ATPase [Rhodococcus sp. BP-321]MBY6423886.1 HAD-IC family P-type ATPase [Rhodococcus sp. BP-324]MBY6427843.1 HAD-IC family P-type ATPase [Rhodococcus sp. BP-323]MBY6431842.1 HAD-IC family P-type ATPase [Rhodococcus sp. BP-322]